MPRLRENASARGSRFSGVISGTTFVTAPSGTTIYNTTVEAGTVGTDNLVNTGGTGYTLPYLTGTGLLMATGKVQVPAATGVTKVDAAYFGLTAVLFCVAQASALLATAGSTLAWTRVTTSKGTLFPTAGVSRVYFRNYMLAGAALKKNVSVQYFAVGT